MFASIIHSKDLSNLQMSAHLAAGRRGRRQRERRCEKAGTAGLGYLGHGLTLLPDPGPDLRFLVIERV